MTRSDLLVINKTDLAPLVGASLQVMADDAGLVRDGRPVLFTSLVADPTATEVARWVRAVQSELTAQQASGLPVSGLPVSGLPVSGLPVSGLPVSGLPVSGLPVSGLPVPDPSTG